MKHSVNPALVSPPLDEEFEFSIFGAGIGESVAMHVGGGEWVLVDSCIDQRTANPVAIDYLGSLGVDFSRKVKALVLTHWHNDHTRGAAEIVEVCPAARTFASVALKTDEFKRLVAASEIEPNLGTDAFLGVLEGLKRRNPNGRLEEIGFSWAMANRVLFKSTHATVTALSPSDANVSLAFREIAQLVQKRPRPRTVSQGANEIAVALWIECGSVRALLGADLEVGGSSGTGWRGILSSSVRPEGKALIFKAPHHGSANADHPEIWTALLEENPLCGITPFNGGRKPLPSPADILRIRTHTDQAYITHPPRGPRLSGVSRTVEKVAKQVAPDIRDIGGPMGHVRFRIPMVGGKPKVETFGKAAIL